MALNPPDGVCSGAELVVIDAKLLPVGLPIELPVLTVEEGDKGRVDDEVAMLPDDPEPRPLREAGYLRKPTKWVEGIGFPVVLSNS